MCKYPTHFKFNSCEITIHPNFPPHYPHPTHIVMFLAESCVWDVDGGRGGGDIFKEFFLFQLCLNINLAFSTKKLKPIMLKISENKFIATYGMLIAIFGFQKKIPRNNKIYVGAN